MDRRKFLQRSGLGVVAAMTPGHVLATSMAPLYTGQVDPGNEYTLLRINQIFPGYHFPYIRQFSTEHYNLNFRLYNFYADFVKDAGTLDIKRTNVDVPEFTIKATREAAADVITELNDTYIPDFVGSYIFEGKIKTLNNLLATPVSWSCETRIVKGDSEEAYLNTRHKWVGRYEDQFVFYKAGSNEIQKGKINGELGWKWGIIHLVQRMSEQLVKEIHFSALDEMDMIYDHQYVRFRKKQLVDCGRGELEFSVYDLLGDGIIPTVYWVDNHHRVAFIISGVEAYVIF